MLPGKNNYDIIFENEDYLAINKPSGLLTIPDREQALSLKDMLSKKYGKIFTVHRLDRDTSGLILFAKNESTHKYLSGIFESREVEKYYLGVVKGCPEKKEGIIEAAISEHPLNKGMMVVHAKGKPSTTSYEVIDPSRSYSLVLFRLHTGRTHQIRLHAKHIGHPIACDDLYGDGKPVFLSSIKKNYKRSLHDLDERPMLSRLGLHAFRLVFNDGNENRTFEAPIPKEFRALMRQVKKNE